MKIETTMSANKADDSGAAAVETIESRLLRASQEVSEVMGRKRPNPEFEGLYQQLLAMEGQGKKAIYEFLKSLRGADGVTPAYPSAKALMAITLQVLIRLKDEKLDDSLLYKEVSGANSLAFSMDLFVKSFMREVFQPMDDDAWEKSEW